MPLNRYRIYCQYNLIILDSDLKALEVNFVARPLTSELKIF